MTDFIPYGGDVLTGIATRDSAEPGLDLPGILQIGAQDAWSQARPDLETSLRALLGQGDLIGKGWTLRDIDLRLAQNVVLQRAQGASSIGGAIPMQMRLAPNLLIATSTTPTVFGSDFDPRFSVDFGIVIDFSISVVPERLELKVDVGSAHVTGADGTGNPHLDSQNLVGDIIDALASVVSPFFGGPNYVQMIESIIGRHDFAGVLNKAIKPLNDALGQLAKQGIGAIVALFPDAAAPAGLSGQSVNIAGSRSPESTPLLVLATPVTGDGTIRGEIRWPKSAGSPAIDPPFVGAFTIAASVDRGAAVGEFAQATDVTHLAGWESADTESDHVVRYTLAGLPTDEPISIEAAANSAVAWAGPAASMIHMLERDGWRGRVTVRPPVAVSEAFRTHDLNEEAVNIASSIAEQAALNPQPIPPGIAGRVGRAGGMAGPSVAEQVALNPQPIPPGIEGRLSEQSASGIGIKASTSRQFGEREVEGIKVSSKFDHRFEPGRLAGDRIDPDGAGTVDGIDFRVEMVDQPH